jgi:hypothetical protein
MAKPVDEKDLEKHNQFVCSICTNLAWNAVSLQGCNHVFCDACIIRWFNTRNQKSTILPCPNCKQSTQLLHRQSLIENRLAYQTLRQISIHCLLHEKCSWTGSYDQFILHLTQCNYAPKITCNLCQQSIKQSDLKHHQENDCLAVVKACPYSEYGCTKLEMTIQEWKEHTKSDNVIVLNSHLQLLQEYIANHISTKKRKRRKTENLFNTRKKRQDRSAGFRPAVAALSQPDSSCAIC